MAIVGAGFTGLWTAYYLALTDPTLRIAVLERRIAGFGASGRNGGWCSAFLPMDHERLARRSGAAGVIALQRAMFDTVDEVGRAAAAEGIDCHWAKGGTLHVATTATQLARLKARMPAAREWGFGEDDMRMLEPDEVRARVDVAGVRGAVYSPHCAAIDPGRLVRGLASAVERRGVRLYEATTVTGLRPGRVDTDRGTVRADVVLRATEGYTATLPGLRRRLVPIYSLMLATEPLPDAVWERIGWQGRETLAGGGHLFVYAQRTADGRIAFGGRGAPYHFGSAVRDRFDTDARVHRLLAASLAELWPAAADAAITHRWGGPLGIPRDWTASVGLDRATGMGWAGGYVGDGVAATNLAGRTLAALVTEPDEHGLTALPWVGHRSRSWEPEPLRWLGVNGSRWLAGSADAAEARNGRPARLRGRLLSLFVRD